MSSAVVLKTSGDFKNITKYLRKQNKINKISSILEEYGKKGVDALSAATPVESGKTAASWTYTIDVDINSQQASLSFWNTNIAYPKGKSIGKRGKPIKGKSAPIALILQYGHRTGTGGWVQGRDYINPVLRPLFDDIVKNVWKEVTSV